MSTGKKLRIIISVILLFAVVFIFLSVFKDKYYMSHINAISFPDDVRVVEVQVSTSDVYGMHVLAEEIIETDLSIDEVSDIVKSSSHGENINVFEIEFDENGKVIPLFNKWDDYGTWVDSFTGNNEGKHYYLLNESTPYEPFPLWLFLR
jgi:hypothetical protein